MASITPVILQNNQRQDGTWLVVYRLTHKRKSVYIKTSHSISKAQLNKDNTIKQKYVIDYLSDDIKSMQNKIDRLGLKVEGYSAAQLKKILTIENEDIDFISFSEEYIEKLKTKLKPNAVNSYKYVLNHIKDYQNGMALYARDITSKYLKGFFEYVQQPKEMIRFGGVNGDQKMVLNR